MGVINPRILAFLVFVLTSFVMMSQDKPAVHKINGKKYYLHVVEKGNTIYGIHKLYNVTVDQLMSENPVVKKEGLRVNQTLLIPVTTQNKKELGAAVQISAEYVTHQVQAKETLYSISKQYGCDLDDILKANLEIKELGLRSGDEIRIPVKLVKVEEPYHIAVAEPDSLEGHRVEKGETLYALGQKYNVKVEHLIESNNGLPIGLKEGMVLRIPGNYVVVDIPIDSTPALDSIARVDIRDSSEVNVLLLLPLMPSFPDSTTRGDFEINEVQRVALSFYRGFIYAMERSRINKFNIQVYDTGKDSVAIQALLEDPTIDSSHVVVGPFYTEQFEMVADHFSSSRIPVICPVPKPSKILFRRPNSIKTTPSQTMQLSSLAEYLALNYQDSNVVLVNSNKFEDQENLEFFKTQYTSALNLPDTFVDDAIREIMLWDINLETIKMRLPDSGRYTLVVPSTNKVFFAKLLGGLFEVSNQSDFMYQFRIIGMESWKRSVKDFDINHVHKLNLTLPLISHVDFDDYRIRNFYSDFSVDNEFEPDEHVVSGYDLGMYLIEGFSSDASNWYNKPESTTFDGLISDFSFARKLPGSGVENRVIHLYEYDNYKLKKLVTWPSVEKK